MSRTRVTEALSLVAAACVALALVTGCGSTRATRTAALDSFTSPSTTSAAAGQVVNGVDQATLQKCIAADNGDCTKSVPGLAECMAKRLVCNLAASSESTVVPQGPAGPVDEARAIEVARSLANGPTAAQDRDGAPVGYLLTTYAYVQGSLHESVPSKVNLSNKVWAVTVHGAMYTDGSPATKPSLKNVYTAYIDQQTGIVSDLCVGCDSIPVSSVPPTSVPG